ncbi:hypothetical protein LguiB_020951 [Lonicera macranthoides]
MPIASSTVETITSADPAVLAGSGGALFLAYLLPPHVWSNISFSLRGYKGELPAHLLFPVSRCELTPAQMLDLMYTKNHIMIDIRLEKDKEKAGIPRLPPGARSKLIAIPLITGCEIGATRGTTVSSTGRSSRKVPKERGGARALASESILAEHQVAKEHICQFEGQYANIHEIMRQRKETREAETSSNIGQR